MVEDSAATEYEKVSMQNRLAINNNIEEDNVSTKTKTSNTC